MNKSFPDQPCGEQIVLTVQGKGLTVPSFKNTKRAILDRNTGNQRTLTPGKIKKRMQELEDGILLALYSFCQTSDAGTHTACLKRLRTALLGLSDDSVREIPEGWHKTRKVSKGNEGVEIVITQLADSQKDL